jgi:hypothetical protein
MRRVIREIITLVRVERWFVAEDAPLSNAPDPTEHVIEQIVLDAADAAQLHDLFQRLLAAQRLAQHDASELD